VDEALVRFASGGPLRARVADAYARIFRPRGLLRRKLILAFAILESSRGFHEDFTSGHRGGGWSTWLVLARVGAGFALALGLGIVPFGPRQLLGGQETR
jgi:hypothetical protein